MPIAPCNLVSLLAIPRSDWHLFTPWRFGTASCTSSHGFGGLGGSAALLGQQHRCPCA